MRKELQTIFDQYFSYLTDEFKFQIIDSQYDPQAFGNFVIELWKKNIKLKIISDRSQIFVELYEPKSGWVDKEHVLETNGILRSRFPDNYGLWDGYKIQNQSEEIKKYRSFLNI